MKTPEHIKKLADKYISPDGTAPGSQESSGVERLLTMVDAINLDKQAPVGMFELGYKPAVQAYLASPEGEVLKAQHEERLQALVQQLGQQSYSLAPDEQRALRDLLGEKGVYLFAHLYAGVTTDDTYIGRVRALEREVFQKLKQLLN
jgi:hypothetical protein